MNAQTTPNNKKQNSEFWGWIIAIVVGGVLALLIALVSTHSSKFTNITHNASHKLSDNPTAMMNESKKTNPTCTFSKQRNQCFNTKEELCEADIEAAKIAWTYFENNYQKDTGLFNAANNYPSTTMWDTGSALAATIAAEDFGFISKKEFDDKITALIKTLVKIKLFDDIAPNKVYNTKNVEMVTYANKVTPDGIGISVLDLARLVSWLNTLTCKHPKFKHQVKLALDRWNFDTLIKDGRMHSIKRYPKTGETKSFQEGRFGYEQYAAKILKREGHDLYISSTYNNQDRNDIDILGVTVATDNRTPEEYHSSNSVVSESYIMDAIENGYDDENTDIIDNIYKVQKRRWEQTGIVTAISEDNINRKPYFIYNTIFSGGKTWVAKTSKGEILQQHKTVSNKAALAMAILYPEDEYSTVLVDKVKSAYDPKKGWYSGIYENGDGYNSTTTANTNGVILSALLYKKYGSTYQICEKCQAEKKQKLDSKLEQEKLNAAQCQVN